MAMPKAIEVVAVSDKSWKDAAQNAIGNAAKPGKDIRSIYIENMEATVEDGSIVNYRIDGKITYLLERTRASERQIVGAGAARVGVLRRSAKTVDAHRCVDRQTLACTEHTASLWRPSWRSFCCDAGYQAPRGT